MIAMLTSCSDRSQSTIDRLRNLRATGLNHYLLRQNGSAGFEPFDEVIRTPYHAGVTRNLNGLGFRDFARIVERTGFKVRQLEVVPARIEPTSTPRRIAASLYSVATRVPAVRERRGVTIVFVGSR